MSDQKRILLWTTPRTLSTAFARCMMSRDSCKVLVEPSVQPFFFGEEAIEPKLRPGQDPWPNCTWKDFCKALTDPYQGYKEVFVKEMAFRFKTFMDKFEEMIPSDYTHAFLVRNPYRTMPSLYQMWNKAQFEFISDDSWAEMKQIYNWITETKGYEPFVMDADDLQKDPEKVLKGFCEAVRIDYQDTMVNWRPIPEDCMEQMEPIKMAFKEAMESKTFLPKTPKPLIKDEDLPDNVKKSIKLAMPFYLKFKERSLKTSVLPASK